MKEKSEEKIHVICGWDAIQNVMGVRCTSVGKNYDK